MVQTLYKNWLLVSKDTWQIWTTWDKQWKVQKVEIWWAFVQKTHLSKKYIPSANTLYIEDLSHIIFNYFCENSPNFLFMSFFEIINHFSRHNSSIFFLAQTLHTFNKSSPSKWKFPDLWLLAWKLTKCLMSFFKP